MASLKLLWGEPRSLTALWLAIAYFVPGVVVMYVLRQAPRLRAALESRAGMWGLATTQVARNIGLVFLVLHHRGELPGLFAYPAAWGDVAAGVTAPLAASIAVIRY